MLKYLDLEGVELRAKKNSRKRTSTSCDPNDIIYIGGCDKLKPFAASIHGGIGDYSRNVIWSEAYLTNNPFVATLY